MSSSYGLHTDWIHKTIHLFDKRWLLKFLLPQPPIPFCDYVVTNDLSQLTAVMSVLLSNYYTQS